MGGAVSLQQRCRKALVIRAYNIRPGDQTIEDQFSAYSFLKGDGQFYTNADLIKQCLNIGSNDYPWLEPLMQILSGSSADGSSSSNPKAFEIRLADFLSFLETGVLPVTSSDSEATNKPPPGVKKKMGGPETPPRRGASSQDGPASPGTSTTASGKGKQFPPVAPVSLDAGGRQSSRSKLVEVIEIDLSNGSKPLPEGIKLKSSNQEEAGSSDSKPDEETLEIIVRSAPNARLAATLPGGPKIVNNNGKQLWRKREVMRQERTVHYTTVDESGEMQELVEKETTQTEVLHMECRETGEFAHKELTEYEQVETFNEDLVNEVRGHEEYVHLKSLEDEFHYMDSTMPPKGDPADRDKPPSGSPGRHPPGEEERQRYAERERRGSRGDGEEGDYPHGPGSASPQPKGAAQAGYLFEPADAKDGQPWTEEEEAAYRQYCSEFKQGDFEFPMPGQNDIAEASVPVVTHDDDDNEAPPTVQVSVPDPTGMPPAATSGESCDTGAYAVGSPSAEEAVSPEAKPAHQYTSMHDID